MKITVLCGGDSPEREVSLRSGARVAAALAAAGHCVTAPDYSGAPLSKAEISDLKAADAVFLALHGGAGEDGRLQTELEGQGICHYTGTAPKGAAAAMDKDAAKALVASCGVPVAKGALLSPDCLKPPLEYPFVIKPRAGGSSVGLCFVHTAAQWQKLTLSEGFLCEEYLPGREFTVGILGDRALPVVEIRPKGGAYDYAHKYTAGVSEELCPAPLSSQESSRLQELALMAFAALDLRDYGRIDFRADAKGSPRFLEANTLPGMTETSLFPLAASAVGISFTDLCQQMAAMAAKRKKI